MALAADQPANDAELTLDDLTNLVGRSAAAAGSLLSKARERIAADVSADGRLSSALLEREQHAVHALAWLATYAESLKQMAGYATRMEEEGRFGEIEALLTQIACAEFLNQIVGGIPMSQVEVARPQALGLGMDDIAAFTADAAVAALSASNTPPVRARLAELIAEQEGAATFGDSGLDETYEAMRDEMRRFADAEVVPHAHEWHLSNDYVPMAVIEKMAELGVF